MEITSCRIELGLGGEDACGEVGTSQISAPEISPCEVGHAHVGASQVSAGEECPSQVGTPEVCAAEILPDEVGASVVDVVAPGLRARQFAGTTQQGIDLMSVCRHIQSLELVGAAAGEALGLAEGVTELTAQRTSRFQSQCLSQVPEQLMELPHDAEHLEHLNGDSRGLPPVLATECDLSDFLPSAEAVIHGATREALLAEAVVNPAAEVGSQIWAGPPGRLVDGEVRRG